MHIGIYYIYYKMNIYTRLISTPPYTIGMSYYVNRYDGGTKRKMIYVYTQAVTQSRNAKIPKLFNHP